MWIAVVVCVSGFLFWQRNKRRAQRFVRSVCFLEIMDSGESLDSANGQVARLFTKQSTPDADNAAIRFAMDKAERLTSGKQMPWIHQATELGFAIDTGANPISFARQPQAQPSVNLGREFSEHFSEPGNTKSVGPHSPHTPPGEQLLSPAWTENEDGSKLNLAATVKSIARAMLRWLLRGAAVGLVLGLFLPMAGALSSLEVWAVPLLTAYVGAIAGLAIGTVYSGLRWIYRD